MNSSGRRAFVRGVALLGGTVGVLSFLENPSTAAKQQQQQRSFSTFLPCSASVTHAEALSSSATTKQQVHRADSALGGDPASTNAWRAKHPNLTLVGLGDSDVSRSLLVLLTRIRNRDCSQHDFVFFFDRAMRILVEATLGSLTHRPSTVYTPTGQVFEGVERDFELAGVSILRSGDAMLKTLDQAVPGLVTGKILISRDRDLPEMPHIVYYSKLPKDIASRKIILMDPMLASGITAQLAIEVLVDEGVKPEDITVLNLIVTPQAVERLASKFPKVKIVAAALDADVDANKYVAPGLGAFGDRYYGTG